MTTPDPVAKAGPKERRFLDALGDLFVGVKVDGQSGYINLMRIKAAYFQKVVEPALMADIAKALNTLKEKFKGRIKMSYIDPPYNTGGDGFPYSDDYQHASWMTMMDDRLRLARQFLKPSSALFASIDAHERRHLESFRDEQGCFVEESQAKRKKAQTWVWQEDNPSMPQVKEDSQKPEFRDPSHPMFRFYCPKHPVTKKPCSPPKRGWAWP